MKTQIVEKKITQVQEKISFGTRVNLFGILVALQFSRIFKSGMMIFSVFFLPIIILFGVGALIPIQDMVPVITSLLLLLVSGIVFGEIYYSIEKTTFNSNISLSQFTSRQKLMATIFITLLLTTIVFLIEITIVYIFTTNDWFFSSIYMFMGPANFRNIQINWSTFAWGPLFYAMIMNILLCTSIWLIVRFFFNSKRTFYIFLFTYFIFVLVFGGVVTSAFSRTDAMKTDGDTPIISINQSKGLDASQFTWNTWFDYTKFFAPQFFINSQFTSIAKLGAADKNGFSDWQNIDGVWTFVWHPDVYSNYVANGGAIDKNTAAFNELWINSDNPYTDQAVIDFFSLNNVSMSPDINYFMPNGDKAYILCIVLPYAYIIVLTLLGIAKKDRLLGNV